MVVEILDSKYKKITSLESGKSLKRQVKHPGEKVESLSVGKISGKRVNITEETSQNNPQQTKVRVENPKNENAKSGGS